MYMTQSAQTTIPPNHHPPTTIYPEKMVNAQIDKVVFGKNPLVKKSSENGIPFVATYHPKVKDLGKLIKDLLPFLYSDEELEKVF